MERQFFGLNKKIVLLELQAVPTCYFHGNVLKVIIEINNNLKLINNNLKLINNNVKVIKIT